MWILAVIPLAQCCMPPGCCQLPLSQRISFPVRVAVDSAFMDRAALEKNNNDKHAATTAVVNDMFRLVNRFYASTLNFEWHITGNIITPEVVKYGIYRYPEDLLTFNCKSNAIPFDRAARLVYFRQYAAQHIRPPTGVTVALLSGCATGEGGPGMANPVGAPCGRGTPALVAGWRWPGTGRDSYPPWGILAHELGHIMEAKHVSGSGAEYLPGYMMGNFHGSCNAKTCNFPNGAFTMGNKNSICKAMRRNGIGCAMHGSQRSNAQTTNTITVTSEPSYRPSNGDHFEWCGTYLNLAAWCEPDKMKIDCPHTCQATIS